MFLFRLLFLQIVRPFKEIEYEGEATTCCVTSCCRQLYVRQLIAATTLSTNNTLLDILLRDNLFPGQLIASMHRLL